MVAMKKYIYLVLAVALYRYCRPAAVIIIIQLPKTKLI
jgi:hypothetical protein